MKKILYLLFGASIVLVACSRKELIDQSLSISDEETQDAQVEYVEISITGSLPRDHEDTKTSYDFDSNPSKALFSWTSGDKIALIVTKDGVVSAQNRYLLDMSSISDDKKTATFSSLITYHNVQNTEAIGEWISTGLAVYPTGISQTRDDSKYSYSFVKLPYNVSGLSSSVVMVGTPNDAEHPTNYDFRAAMACLRVTIDNIPAAAKELKDRKSVV